MRQYREIKRQNPDAILFFRIGDFYEMFAEDAVVASAILQIALTSRDKRENAVPLCGVPHHAAAGYIDRLLSAGRSVAICEQMEAASAVRGKGMIRREVVRVITPGTVIESALLTPAEPNDLAALYRAASGEIGLAFLDVSTGHFRQTTRAHLAEVEELLAVVDPKEVISPDDGAQWPIDISLGRLPIRRVAAAHFATDAAEKALVLHFRLFSIAALGEAGDAGLVAAGGLLGHVSAMQRGVIGSITALRPMARDRMSLSARTLRHLNLIPAHRQQAKGTLLHLLDQTVTPMGGRLLREWLRHPLTTPAAIEERQARVAALHAQPVARMRLRAALAKVTDMERLVGRINLKAGRPADCVALKMSLAALPAVESAQVDLSAQVAQAGVWDNLCDLHQKIDATLSDAPPLSVKDGGIIRDGASAELDALRQSQKEGRAALARIESAERRRTGIESLKIRYHPVFGYAIEVTEAQVKNVPPDYIRRQTLTRLERFTTPELRAEEEKIAGAEAAVIEVEAQLYDALCGAIANETARVQRMAQAIADLDVVSALAEVAHRNTYVRPKISATRGMTIRDGRHPLVEQDGTDFVPNDTRFDPPSRQILLLTGPNMAGKSTYMKQVGLIVLMAQIGSFVPAREADIGVVDRIFTRVGAEDDLGRGMSTFMVEMTEMAHILRNATEESLLLLDEIGRGTSTFDGISIAWAICEAVHRIGARTMFATHYHELTRLGEMAGIDNLHARVQEADAGIVFLRKMVEGGADRSYGIHVARLAGLPDGVIERATALLLEMESGAPERHAPVLYPTNTPAAAPPPAPHPAVAALREINPLETTPMQALALLTHLVEQVQRP